MTDRFTEHRANAAEPYDRPDNNTGLLALHSLLCSAC
jgi:hypothetical protein